MEKGRLPGTLSRNNRPLDSFLAGHDFDRATINEAVRFGNHLEAAIQRFMVGRIITDDRRITKHEADRQYRHAFRMVGNLGKSLEGGGK